MLRGLDLDIPAGRSLVVIGGSGTGKSVLIKCILGIVEADKGSIRIDGEEVVGADRATLTRVRAKFGMLFQGAALFDSLPVWENVAFGLLARGMDRKRGKGGGDRQSRQRRPRARGRRPGPLRAFGRHAEARGAGPRHRRQARDHLLRRADDRPRSRSWPTSSTIWSCTASRQLGATALSITHDMASVRKIADEVAMLFDGKIVWKGPVARIDDSGNPYVDQFIHGRAEGPIQVAGLVKA